MRMDLATVMMIALVATGAALAGTSGTAAEPANGTALSRSAVSAPLSQVSYVRRHGWVCYRKCYREYLIGHRVCRTFC